MIFAQDGLEHQHILVTGATGGIGWHTVKELLKTGASVTAAGRNKDKLDELKSACEQEGIADKLLTVAADLNESGDRGKLHDQATEHAGPVTGLVNSAGISGGGPVEELSEEDMKKVMELNYFSTVALTQLIYPDMKKANSGAVVNVSSLSGLRATHGNTAYAASKFAVIAFTQAFAHEAAAHGVRVNAVCPGFVDTEMGRNAIQKKADRADRSFEEQMKIVEEGLPSGRITQPEEVARTIIFLLSDAAENIIGESVKISGGAVMR
ncbi:SDR family NAD(P)-dependent oxidoreductase [Jeotgalibacillus terrae]|uniref:SDR family NAD(P)-dependent oxidoreductase n=1 Tax=Jeotgalibacillus terrae TaxID=587735 RepID=A0ABW5ZG87_9BACL|nr:SDR family oxidoreductase [Jeotgalibacillus terrae]MBM7579565.1 3-oxoacyl-[acyl-carrier protein] reductase [Jeotgalibacillus terrae]